MPLPDWMESYILRDISGVEWGKFSSQDEAIAWCEKHWPCLEFHGPRVFIFGRMIAVIHHELKQPN